MTPVRLEPAALRSRVKHSTTEPLLGPSMNGLVTDGNTKLCCRGFVLALFQSTTAYKIDLYIWSKMLNHTGQCKRTGGCYNELVVAFLRTGGGLKGKKSIPVDFMIYLSACTYFISDDTCRTDQR